MEPEDLDDAAALLRRLLVLLPPAGPDDTILAHRIEGAATALEVQSDTVGASPPSQQSTEQRHDRPSLSGDGPTD